jgi:hypothetical protein
MQASTPSLTRLAQIARRWRPLRSMNDICIAFFVILAVGFRRSLNKLARFFKLDYQAEQFLAAS